MPTTKCGYDDGPVEGAGRFHLTQRGPTLMVQIGFDPDYDANKPEVPPKLPPDAQHALIDTGALESCIDSSLAIDLKLPIIDRRMISGVQGVFEVNMHLAHIRVPTLNFTIHGSFAGVNLIAGGQAHYALIGRTFLQNFEMVYEGKTGTVTLTS